MKKTTLIMTTAVIAALSLLIGCGDGGDDETPTGYQNPKESSTSFQTFYIKAVDAAREDPWKDIADLNRLHFHAPAGTGFVIQKIFLSDTMSKEVPADATVWYDFTAGESLEDCTKGNYGGTMANGGIRDGAWVLENTGTGEVYPGNLGLALDGKVYVGFIIKNVSEDLKFDNILLEFRYTGDASYTSLSFANFFGLETTEPIDPDPGPNPGPGETPDPVLTSEFATYYLDISGISGLTGFRIKNTSGADAGIIIDEIFASGDMSEADKAVAFDFEEPEGGTNWWGFSTGTKADGAWSSGEQATDSHDIAAFGSEVFNGKQYLGIKAKNLSEAVKGDTLLIAPLTENGEVAEFTKTFAELFVAGIPASIPVLGAEFATYYLDIAATEFDGVDGIHFHNKTANELGMVVDRIFATNTLGVAEAVILEFDGTDKSAEDDAENGSYYWSGLSGTDGTATAGAAAGEGNYAYIGGFATPLFAGKAYIGIVAKNVSSTVKGDEITVQPIISGEVNDSKSKTFAELFVAGIPASIPVLGAEFATYYLDIAATEFDGVDGIHFHNKTANELGMVVDRIFATNTLGVAEAVILEFDGTDKSTEDDAENGSYYWSGLSGTDGTATAGAAAGEGNYAYIGGFATPLFAGKAYIGIVAKNVSSTVKGDEITVQPIISGEVDDSKSKTFAELFSR